MIKFIYPVNSNVGRKRTAWRKLRELCERHKLSVHNPRVRDETFEHATPFTYDDGQPMTERQRVYTFTFQVDEDEAERVLRQMCNLDQKLARRLTPQLVLLCVDDHLGVLPDRTPPHQTGLAYAERQDGVS